MSRRLLVLGSILVLAGCSGQDGIDGGAGDDSDLAGLPDPFVARGNEPGWRLELSSGRIDLLADYGELRIDVAAPPPQTSSTGRRYAVEGDHDLAVTVKDELCADDATGMPHPYRVQVDLEGRTLRGCGGNPASLFEGYEWVVDEIDGEGIDPRSRATFVFEAGRLAGVASCNDYTARYDLTVEGLTLDPGALTLRACPAELMAQETAFLAILNEVSRFSIADDGALVLHGAYGRTITAHR